MKIREFLLMFFVSLVLFSLAFIMITQACAVATAEVMNDFSHRQTPIVDDCVLFDTGADRASYPSIPGEHKGNFTPRKDIKIEKVYTCPCPGTGGHSEFIEFFCPDGTSLGNASWKGYKGDWHNITFDEPIELEGKQTYNYVLKTGSYPQIIHSDRVETPDGIITCHEFIDANGRKHKNWIPAIKFFGTEITEIQPDKTPPASVTDLNETKVGTNYIIWEWKNPLDKDLNHTMIYLNNELLTNLSKIITKFNVTNLTPDTEYKIGIKTVDEAGNINQSIVEDLARTLKLQNKAPIALFNYNPEKPKVNQSIFFNASDSFDPDGEIVKYLWDFNNDDVTDAEGKKVNHPYSLPGIYEAILKVIDNQGAENKTSREINVSANKVPIVDIGGPYSGEVGKPVSFEGYAIDPDGNITRYILNFGYGSNVSRIIDPPQKHVNISELHNYTAADIYNAILKVIDDNYEPGTNQTIVNITEPQVNKTWEKMNFTERRALVEEFLKKDPTPKVVGKSGQQAHYLRVNGTMAKELYGLPCDIPLCWVYSGGVVKGHGMNGVLLGTNKSNIDDWGFIKQVSDTQVKTNLNQDIPPPGVVGENIYNIWKNSTIYPENNKLIAKKQPSKI